MEEGDEEVLVVVSSPVQEVATEAELPSIVQTPEPETEAAVVGIAPAATGGAISVNNNNNRVRPNRRRRGARKNDKNRKFEDEVTKTRSRYLQNSKHFPNLNFPLF